MVESCNNGSTWYRLWSDGWLEQGGHIEESGVNAVSITFPKPFAQIPILLTTSCSSNRTTYLDNNIDVYNLSAVGFTKQYVANVGTGWSWRAEGYQD